MVVNVVLVVHTLSVVLRITLSLFAVEPVLALCFRKAVNLNLLGTQRCVTTSVNTYLGAGNACEHLLSELVRNRLA